MDKTSTGYGSGSSRTAFHLAPWCVIIGLLLLSFISSSAPPRNGDAMRYHLAQPKEMLRTGIFTFHPDFHYNFPRTFNLVFMLGEYMNWPSFAGLVCWVVMVMACLAATMMSRMCLQEIGEAASAGTIVMICGLCFYLTPGIFQAASVPNNDGAIMCFYGWGCVFGIRAIRRSGKFPLLSWIAVGLLFGLAIGSKYHGLLLVSLYELGILFIFFRELFLGEKSAIRVGSYILHLLILVAIGCPFYVANYIHTGNPIWPLFAELSGSDDLLTQMASGYRMAPRFDVGVLLQYIQEPFLANPMILISVVFLSSRVLPSKTCRLVAICTIAYMGAVVVLTSYHRFLLMAWPHVTAMATCGFFVSMANKTRRFGSAVLIAVSLATGSAFAIWYSADFVRWAVGSMRSDDIREMSFYYPDYTWMNRNLDKLRDRVLLVVKSGHSYYLDIPYFRADPELTAAIDWDTVCHNNCDDLVGILRDKRVSHLFIDRKVSRRVDEVVDRLEAAGSARRLYCVDHRMLLAQRMTRRVDTTVVVLYEICPAHGKTTASQDW